jgi:hypothetical protein
MNFKVQNFKYNGFMVDNQKGITDYTAKFIEWTQDPGIAKCNCSDNKIRLIPSCCLKGNKSLLPKQNYTNKLIFGEISNS